MGKFGRSSKTPAPVAAPVSVDPKAATEDTIEEDKAADRLRLAEKRRRGRRSSILSNIGEEDIQASTFGRPSAASSTATSDAIQAPKNFFGS